MTESVALELVSDGLVTIPEAIRISGFGKTFLYEAMASGELVYVKKGAGRRIPRRALDQWLAEGLMLGDEPVIRGR